MSHSIVDGPDASAPGGRIRESVLRRLSSAAGIVLPQTILAALVCFPSLPGRMSPDSIEQYGQALEGAYTDWHPAIVAWVWHQLGASPNLIALQTVLVAAVILVAAGSIMRSAGLDRISAYLGTVVFACLPPVHGYLTTVSKDTWSACLLLVVAASMLRRNGPAKGAGSVARGAVYAAACAIRPELVVFVPFVVAGEAAARRPSIRACGFLLVGFATAWAALSTFETAVVDPKRTYPAQQMFLFDLAGLSLARNEMLLPPENFPARDLEVLRRHHTYLNVAPIVWGVPKEELVVLLPPDESEALRPLWLSSVASSPLEWINGRAKLGRAYMEGFWTFHPNIDVNPWLTSWSPELLALVNRYLSASPQPIRSHWFPTLGSLALACAFAVRRTRRSMAWASVAAFACTYQIGLVFVATAPDFRYGYGAVAIFYAMCIAVAGRLIGSTVGKRSAVEAMGWKFRPNDEILETDEGSASTTRP